MPEQAAKTCIWCKQDCSTKPRQKDLKGNYLCKECVQPYQQALTARARQRRPEKTPTTPAPSDSTAGTGDVLISMIDQTIDMDGDACPSCSRVLALDAVICTHCGYNKNTGRQMRSRVEMLKREKGESKTMKAAGAVADTASFSLLMGTILCCVAGAAGAAAWAGVAYYTGFEIGYLAWGVGFLVGAGMMAGSRGYSGLPTGLIAAGVATVSIMAGKYIVISYVVDSAFAETSVSRITDDDGIIRLADDVIAEKETQGVTLVWPDGMSVEDAFVPEDYPPGIWDEAEKRWFAKDQAQRDRELAQIRDDLDRFVAMVKEEGFISSFGLLDIIFFGLAIVTAFGLGSGGTFE